MQPIPKPTAQTAEMHAVRQKNFDVIREFFRCKALKDRAALFTQDGTLTKEFRFYGEPVEVSVHKLAETVDGVSNPYVRQTATTDWVWYNTSLYSTPDPDVILVENWGEGKLDGLPGFYCNHFVHIFTLDQGKIRSHREFCDPKQLMRAMGLAVPSMPDEIEGSERDRKYFLDDQTEWLEDSTVYRDTQADEAIRQENLGHARDHFDDAFRLSGRRMDLYGEKAVRRQPFPFYGVSRRILVKEQMAAPPPMPGKSASPGGFPGWHTYDYHFYPTGNPNTVWLENRGEGEQSIAGTSGHYRNHYMHCFRFDETGKILEYREFCNPIQMMRAMGLTIPEMSYEQEALDYEMSLRP